MAAHPPILGRVEVTEGDGDKKDTTHFVANDVIYLFERQRYGIVY